MEAPEDIVHQFDMDPDDWRAIISRKKVAYADEALLEACRLVQKVHGAQNIENAVCKYYVAHDVFKLHPMDLHPLEDPFDNEYLLSERIRIANVIFLFTLQLPLLFLSNQLKPILLVNA